MAKNVTFLLSKIWIHGDKIKKFYKNMNDPNAKYLEFLLIFNGFKLKL